MSLKNKLRSPWVKNTIKLLLTGVALYFVFSKIEPAAIGKVIAKSEPLWLLVAFFLYNLSKLIASERLYLYYKSLGLSLNKWYHIQLYYLGMFYNLFLPGGIGGDGYKVYLLRQHAAQISTKQLVGATLFDRLSGLVALAVLALVFMTRLDLPQQVWISPLAVILAVVAFPILFVLQRIFFSVFNRYFLPTALYSLGVQSVQLVASWALLYSLGITSSFFPYLTLFLFSSVAAALPFTVGGVGARELVFLYGTQLLPITEETAIAFSLLFFAITACSSLLGLLCLSARLSKEGVATKTTSKLG